MTAGPASDVAAAVAALPPLREVVRRFGLAADKRLGQHFLFDPSILARIVRAAGPLHSCTVLEVGPGPGGLTRALLAASAARVVAIERDPRCIEALQELVSVSNGRLELVAADAREFNPAGLAALGELRLVANLPYNVGTDLLIGWLHELAPFHSLVLLFQREVALRLAATPNTTDYGRLTVLAQAMTRVERLLDLPAAAFIPPPKVASSLVRLVPRPDRPAPELRRALERLTAAAFGQRRKMLRSSLKAAVPNPEALLTAAGLDPARRAETLTVPDFLRLAELMVA